MSLRRLARLETRRRVSRRRVRLALAALVLAGLVYLLGPARLVAGVRALLRAEPSHETEWHVIQDYTFRDHVREMTGL